ncbi:MAG: O-methyltransferase [bacterium]|nr:O-methyltransferase [bacterium]
MIVNERVRDYICSLERSRGACLDRIEEEAREQGVPILRKETAAFLETLVASLKPKAILEVGTAVAYSALLMSRAMPEDCRITTIESYEPRIVKAKENLRLAGEERIQLLEGDATDILKTLEGPYDFIFMDAAKGQYLHWLDDILRLLSAGGVLLSDNVLQEGRIVESRFAIERRDRTIHARMREYLFVLTHREDLLSAVLPIGDGLAMSTKLDKTIKNR